MLKPTLAIDIDDVLAGFVPAMLEFHNARYGTNLRREDVYSYKFWEVWGTSQDEAIRRVVEFSRSGSLAELPLIDGARDAIRVLGRKYELHAVTARREEFSESTHQWLEVNFSGMFSGVHFADHLTDKHRSKGEICDEIGAVAIIDDSHANALDCLHPSRNVLLLDAPWNTRKEIPDGMQRVFSWRHVLEVL